MTRLVCQLLRKKIRRSRRCSKNRPICGKKARRRGYFARHGERGETHMTRDAVLKLLIRHDGYLSGEVMSGQLGVSRCAVFKAVRGLRNEGYNIEARTNVGYRLVLSADLLNRRELVRHLGKMRAPVYFYESAESTNTLAKLLGERGAPHGTLVTAARQTAGRGRLGRAFFSDSPGGVWMTTILRPDIPVQDAALLTVLAAVAVVRVLKVKCNLLAGIKWTNDILIGGKKLCGILTEMTSEAETGRVQQVALGIGLNANQKKEDFPQELTDVATSLYIVSGRKFERAALIAAIYREVLSLFDTGALTVGRPALLSEYRGYLVGLRKEISVRQACGQFKATALGIDDRARLLVRLADGSTKALESGEISILLGD